MFSFISITGIWLIVAVVLLIIEAVCPGLVSIWFALGALAAAVSSAAGAHIWLQALLFIIVSVVALVLTRPLVKKYINKKVQPTNADMIIGREGIVKEKIDNVSGTGAVSIGGKVWTARCVSDAYIILEGEKVRIERIEGVKVIVSSLHD